MGTAGQASRGTLHPVGCVRLVGWVGPGYNGAVTRVSSSTIEPLVEELRPVPETEAAWAKFCALPHCLFLDSATVEPRRGRYSFLAADPFAMIRSRLDEPDALGRLAAALAAFAGTTIAGLPLFQGGAAGLFSYELGRQLEDLPGAAFDEFGVPVMAVGLFDVVVAWDHLANRAWIISQGFPETEPAARSRRAARRLAAFARLLKQDVDWPTSASPSALPPIDRTDLAPSHAVPGRDGLASDFTEDAYLRSIERVVDYIATGDVFQVNLAQRLICPARDDPVALYRRLRRANPAPFAGYFDLGDFQVASASPERFVQVRDGAVETRPIKGTRPRAEEPQQDEAVRRELCQSAKDRAENVMIVDLMRNDLGRVCRPGSVRVEDVCRLETYQFVHHLVSSVTGRLREGLGAIDLLRAAFPGGSITGAPKIRAMQIIAELEPVARGPYCGSLGYLGFDGAMDLSILIRTITAGRGWWQAPVGGGIVAESDPAREYAETWHKAEGLLRAMQSP
ncbi:MAG: aminodeoxychorismate synthase component I [Pirellulales bacterium]|nr:aminodeoxychorismate synthase component I [Pirellulales bacterium]